MLKGFPRLEKFSLEHYCPMGLLVNPFVIMILVSSAERNFLREDKEVSSLSYCSVKLR